MRALTADQSDVTERMVEVSGRRLFVRELGTGFPLLLLNGLGLPLDMWARLEPQLASARLIEVDLPGAGRSEPERTPLTMPSYARLATRLLDELNVQTADVLGLSFGGMVAQQLAIDAPSRVRKLVLASTSCGWGGVPANPLVWSASLIDTPRYGDAVLRHPPAGVRQAGQALWGSTADGQQRRLPRPRSYLRQILAASTWSSLPWLPGVRAETLVIAGSADPLVPAANASQLATWLPNARTHVVPDGGHLCVLERAAEVGPVIAAFLADRPRPEL